MNFAIILLCATPLVASLVFVVHRSVVYRRRLREFDKMRKMMDEVWGPVDTGP